MSVWNLSLLISGSLTEYSDAEETLSSHLKDWRLHRFSVHSGIVALDRQLGPCVRISLWISAGFFAVTLCIIWGV